jgi:hypothetical protein
MRTEALEQTRDSLHRWSKWCRPGKTPGGFAGETIEHSLMVFGGGRPKGKGRISEPDHPLEERVEAAVTSMPAELKVYIVAEYITRGSPSQRAAATFTSVPKYYTELNSALWWLHGNGKCK